MTATSEASDLGIETDWDAFTSVERDETGWSSECGACSWLSEEFDTEDAARAAIEEHWSKYCPAK